MISVVRTVFLLVMCSMVWMGCKKDQPEIITPPTPYVLNIPPLFKEKLIPPVIPIDNPLTEEGVTLGKRLFFELYLLILDHN